MVYSSCDAPERKELWDSMTYLASQNQIPWLDEVI